MSIIGHAKHAYIRATRFIPILGHDTIMPILRQLYEIYNSGAALHHLPMCKETVGKVSRCSLSPGEYSKDEESAVRSI